MSAISRAITPTEVWRKPRRVTLDEGYLVADVERESLYPILDAAGDGRALQALSDARTDDAACAFTKTWGFLHVWFEGRRRDRFPLPLFRLHQRYFFALVRLCAAVRTRPDDQEEIAAALLALKASRAERETYLYPQSDARHKAVRTALQSIGVAETRTPEDYLTNAEHALVDQGVPMGVLFAARGERRGTIGLPEYAARTVASELSGVQYRVRPVWRAAGHGQPGGSWGLEEIPIVDSLEQVLRLTVRSRFDVLHHYFCEGCGRAVINGRAGARFCSETCATRVRVAQWRAEQAAKRRAAERKAARKAQRRSARSAKRRAGSSGKRDTGRAGRA